MYKSGETEETITRGGETSPTRRGCAGKKGGGMTIHNKEKKIQSLQFEGVWIHVGEAEITQIIYLPHIKRYEVYKKDSLFEELNEDYVERIRYQIRKDG